MAYGTVNVQGASHDEVERANGTAAAALAAANAAVNTAGDAKNTADAASATAGAAKTIADDAKAIADASKAASEQAVNSASAAAQAAREAQNAAEEAKNVVESGGGGGGGNVIKITFEAEFLGQPYTVTDGAGEVKAGTVPDSLIVNVSVTGCNTTYTITSTADGVEYSNTITTGAYYGQYTASLSVFTATINVTAAPGAEVSATIGSSTYTATAGADGTASIQVKRSGTYTVSATKDGATSNTATTSVTTNGGTATATVSFIALKLTSPSGSAITVQNDNTTFTAISTGTNTFYLPYAGTWNASITKDGETATGSVSATAYQTYTLDLAFVHIYGVSWDGTSTTKWTRTDEAADFTDPVPYVAGSSKYGSPFDNLQPWAGMVKSERTGGTMVAIPKFWYKLTQSGKSLKIQIADKATAGYSVSPAHMDRGDGKGERDVVYVGRYHCASDYKSKTGVSPKVSITRSTARSGIHALGSNIWQMDFATRFSIWLLYLVEFADWNSQKTIGKGCGNNSAPQNMGYTDSMPYHTGTTQTSRDTYGLGTQYRNIEGLWDNVLDWEDGCYNSSSGLMVILNPNSYSDNSGGKSVGTPCKGWPTEFTVSSAAGFPMFYGSKDGGSETVASCDYWYFSASYPVVFVGGDYSQGGYYGLFCRGYYAASYSLGDIGSRLHELP